MAGRLGPGRGPAWTDRQRDEADRDHDQSDRGQDGVATSANVLATFSEPMRAATVIKSTVKVVRKGTTKSLAATLTYDAARRRATLNPTSALARGAVYTATVSTGVRDAAGNPMAKARSWSFTVRR